MSEALWTPAQPEDDDDSHPPGLDELLKSVAGRRIRRGLSAWLTGKRRPGAAGLMAIDRVYHISPRDLDLAPADFAQLLADRERMAEAEENLRVYVGVGVGPVRKEVVVPIKRRKKR